MKIVFHFDGSAALRDGEVLCPERDAAAFERLLPEMEVLWHVLKPVTADVIARVSFWNLHDGQSWLNYFPWRRVNHPLLFDRDGQPKPAFDAVIQALTQ